MSYVRYGILAGFAVELFLLFVLRSSGDANLLNFGPAILAGFVLILGIILALACLVAGITLLFRRRWNGAGYYLFTGATVFALMTKWILYSN